MKTIGILGGMSWESTVTYYQLLNEAAKERFGGLASARILLHSVNFAEMECRMSAGKWEECAEVLTAAAKGLVGAGADMMLIATNTLHKVADEVAAEIPVPLLHIADATADALQKAKVNKVALLGTAYTMQQDFYKKRLWNRGFDVLLPNEEQMQEVNRIIFDELCKGIVTDTSKAFYLALIDKLAQQGAQAVILGCTEIGMLVAQKDTDVPLFDTTVVHAAAAAEFAFGN